MTLAPQTRAQIVTLLRWHSPADVPAKMAALHKVLVTPADVAIVKAGMGL